MRAGKVDEVRWDSGEWLFVDPGFSRIRRSCGLLLGDGDAEEVTFGDLRRRVLKLAEDKSATKPLNLLIEAPLSVAFTRDGNPTGRSIEKRDEGTRYWYVGLGCAVMVSASYLISALMRSPTTRDVRLFEGFVSFKKRGVRSSHSGDVIALREVVRGDEPSGGVTAPERLSLLPDDLLASSLDAFGMDLGIPPVVTVLANKSLQSDEHLGRSAPSVVRR